jgi:hypothetical protein
MLFERLLLLIYSYAGSSLDRLTTFLVTNCKHLTCEWFIASTGEKGEENYN